MSWLAIFSVGVLTAVVSGLLSFVVAELGVEWYHVSSFEGNYGFLVIFIVLAAFVGGLVLGAIAASVIGASGYGSFGKALGISVLIVVSVAILTAGFLRALADVPPTLDGEELMLLVEVRWPATRKDSPALDPVYRTLELGILSGNVQRVSRRGPLWMEDTRREGGRWIVPGAVELFTTRGTRVVQVQPTFPGAYGLTLPMSGTPSDRDLQWSVWLPRLNGGIGIGDEGFSCRYKVIPRSQPSRTQTLGHFQIDTLADSFYLDSPGANPPEMIARAEFAVRYHGELVDFAGIGDAHLSMGSRSKNSSQAPVSKTVTRAQAVATLPGLPTALLVRVEMADEPPTCRLVTDGGSRAIVTIVARCEYQLSALPLSNDVARQNAAKSARQISGRIDRETFMHPGTYLFSDALFDTDHRILRRIDEAAFSTGFSTSESIPPLGTSPDGRSIVRAGEAWAPIGTSVLQDFDVESNTSHLLVIDRTATRFAGGDAVDSNWLEHYYEWQRDDDGHDRLVARTRVKPLPYRGVLHTESNGDLAYHVQPVGSAMCDRLAEFLVSDFAAERAVKEEYGESYSATVEKTPVHVFVNSTDHQVVLYLDSGSDISLVRRIAKAFDAVLATGKYDELFENYQ